MNLKDRFIDYWRTDLAYGDYTYNISIFEQIVYGFVGTVGGVIGGVSLFLTAPIWGIPYIIYKNVKIKNEENE